MPTFAPPTQQLAQNITATLARLRSQRDDGPPDHDPLYCGHCATCATERLLNRYLDKVKRSKPLSWPHA